MNWQQIATLVFLVVMIGVSFWAYKESMAYHKEQREKQLSSEKSVTQQGKKKQKKKK